MRHIALIGKARSGKDTTAERLIKKYAYTRVAFADPLKEMALRADPIVDWEHPDPDEIADGRSSEERDAVHLSELVDGEGWERAKDDYPEVRRFLQRLGQTQREFDEDFWLRIALRKVEAADNWNLPVVVTDVRYLNELLALQNVGFTAVRIVRPATETGDTHASETELDSYRTRYTLQNVNHISELHAQIDGLF